jgi:CubicO group peptidase (beta-lactamase class C family)/outer membrane protein OmpA-like peptidoglycan-associated protein
LSDFIIDKSNKKTKRMKFLQFIIIFMLGISMQAVAVSDFQIEGQVLDKNTKEALPFANLAIIGTTTGVATDLEGNFILKLKQEHFDDTLMVSMMGYQNMILPVKRLLDQKKNAVFFLSPEAIAIQELVIEGKPIVLENIFFEHNKHGLLPESYPALKQLFDYVNENPDFVIEIAGHTDNTGQDDYNLALSEARAGAVVAWLEQNGIDQRRMMAIGYGEAKPIATNDTQLGQQQNRRVEFRVVHRGFNPITGDIKISKGQDDKSKAQVPNKPKSDEEEKPKAIFSPPTNKKIEPKTEKQVKPTTDSGAKKDFEKRIDNLLEKPEAKFHGVVGTSDGFSKAYGKANLTYDILNTVSTKLYIGNFTEHFTAVLALQLVEQKKMGLTDPISKFLPNYPNMHTKDKITIGHLLSHTSGLMLEKDLPIGLSEKDGKFQHEVYTRLFATQNLRNVPGTVYEYTALNYYLLAVIVEQVAKKNLQALLQENIFGKLKMKETAVYDVTAMDNTRAANYSLEKGKVKNTILTSKELIFGACDMVSTISDLQKWDLALRNNQLLNQETTKILFKENIKGYSFFGKVTDKGQVKITEQVGVDAYYHFGKQTSTFIISNIGQTNESIADLIFKEIQ